MTLHPCKSKWSLPTTDNWYLSICWVTFTNATGWKLVELYIWGRLILIATIDIQNLQSVVTLASIVAVVCMRVRCAIMLLNAKYALQWKEDIHSSLTLRVSSITRNHVNMFFCFFVCLFLKICKYYFLSPPC